MAGLLVTAHPRKVPEAEPVKAYIVEGTSVAAAREVIARVGGKITGDLAIIDGVIAELTLAQSGTIRKQSGIRGVFADAPVTVNTATAGLATSTVADRFEAVKYTNDDGHASLGIAVDRSR